MCKLSSYSPQQKELPIRKKNYYSLDSSITTTPVELIIIIGEQELRKVSFIHKVKHRKDELLKTGSKARIKF